MGFPHEWVSLEFLTIRIDHMETLAICPGSVFLPQYLVPTRISALVSLDSLCLLLSPVLGSVICPVTSLLKWIQEQLLIFQFSFLLTWMERQLLSFLHATLETRSLCPFILLLLTKQTSPLGSHYFIKQHCLGGLFNQI